MRELEVTLSIRNNRLKERRERMGLSQKQLGEAIGMSGGMISQYECMTVSPLNKKTLEWKPTALLLARYFKVEPSELFPDIVFDVKKSTSTKKMDAAQVMRYLATQQVQLMADENEIIDEIDDRMRLRRIDEMMSDLNERQRDIIIRRFVKGETYQEIADHYGRDRERIRQLQAQALHKMRLRFWRETDDARRKRMWSLMMYDDGRAGGQGGAAHPDTDPDPEKE